MLRLRRSTLNCRMMFCIPPGRLDTIPQERAVWEGRGRGRRGGEERGIEGGGGGSRECQERREERRGGGGKERRRGGEGEEKRGRRRGGERRRKEEGRTNRESIEEKGKYLEACTSIISPQKS